jgi:hypothetical protein
MDDLTSSAVDTNSVGEVAEEQQLTARQGRPSVPEAAHGEKVRRVVAMYVLFATFAVFFLLTMHGLVTRTPNTNCFLDCSPSIAVSDAAPSSPTAEPSTWNEAKTALEHFWVKYREITALEWVFLLVASAPYVIGLWIFLVIKRVISTIIYRLTIPDRLEDGSLAERARNACLSWEYESMGKDRSLERALLYSHLLGWLVSIVLLICILVIDRTPSNHLNFRSVAVGVASATLVSFALEIGGILIRVANNDVSARMFAGAMRTIVTVIIAAAFLPALLQRLNETSLMGSTTGQALLGVAVALMGRQALAIVTTRAGGILGVKTVTPENRADLRSIDGMNEEDIDRLSEEGVDSIHALAYIPTPRLFFSTTYRLQRICDWQDQALLIELAGQTLAQAFRNNLAIRGVIDAKVVSLQLLLADRSQSRAKAKGTEVVPKTENKDLAPSKEQEPSSLQGNSGNQKSEISELGALDECDDSIAEPLCRRFPIEIGDPASCFKILGLTDCDQARIALSTLAADVRIDELRVFYESEVRKEAEPEGASEDLSDPNKGKFGGSVVSNHRQLSATYFRSLVSGLTDIRLCVSSTEPEKYKLTGTVTFVLHPSFKPKLPKVDAINGVASLDIEAWGAFTVGAIADGGRTKLELDLAGVWGAEEAFYEK